MRNFNSNTSKLGWIGMKVTWKLNLYLKQVLVLLFQVEWKRKPLAIKFSKATRIKFDISSRVYVCTVGGEFINLFLIASRCTHACPFAAHKAPHRCAHKNKQIMHYIRSQQSGECLFFSLDRIPPHSVSFCSASGGCRWAENNLAMFCFSFLLKIYTGRTRTINIIGDFYRT